MEAKRTGMMYNYSSWVGSYQEIQPRKETIVRQAKEEGAVIKIEDIVVKVLNGGYELKVSYEK
jgi:hypothetical protein